MLDEDVQVLGGIRVERRRQNAAVAQRARAEFHAAVHPGHDLVVVQLRHRGVDDLVGGQQVAEAQLAVLQHLLDFGGGKGRAQAERVAAPRAAPAGRRRARRPAPRRWPSRRCPPPAARTRSRSRSAFRAPKPAARSAPARRPGTDCRPLPAMRITAASTARWMPAATCGAHRFGNRRRRPSGPAARRSARRSRRASAARC